MTIFAYANGNKESHRQRHIDKSVFAVPVFGIWTILMSIGKR